MSRIRTREPLLPRTSPSGLQGEAGLPERGAVGVGCALRDFLFFVVVLFSLFSRPQAGLAILPPLR